MTTWGKGGRFTMGVKVAAALWAGMAAAVVSTAVEVVLWTVFTHRFPAVLYRDAGLTAALVLGPRALPPPTDFDAGRMALASVIHVALSLVYGLAAAVLVDGPGKRRPWLTGAGFGAALYGVNLYGFTLIFPWFVQARDWITLTAHIAFGVTCAVAYHGLARGAVIRRG
jgi:hypothetical protein